MNEWTKAKKLIQLLFESGYLSNDYGEIRASGTNGCVPYPLTPSETQFLFDYFKGEKK